MDDYDTPKRKRKGLPQQRRTLLLSVLVCALLVGVGVYLWLALQPAVSAPLAAFAINQAETEIALSWRSETSGVWGTRPWDAAHGVGGVTTLLGGLEQAYITNLSYSPDDTLLLSLSSDRWAQINSGIGVMTKSPNITDAVYAPQGDLMGLLTADLISIIRVPLYGQPIQQIRLNALTGPTIEMASTPRCIMISADATRLVLIRAADAPSSGTLVDVIDIASGHVTAAYMLAGGKIGGAALRPDGQEIAVAVDTTVYRVDLRAQKITGLPIPRASIRQVLYDPAGPWLAAVGGSSEAPGLYLYNLKSNAPARMSVGQLHAPVVHAQFVREGLVVGDQSNQLTLWAWNGELWTPSRTWAVPAP